ncbi:MAG TPA: fumarylacetoacetate hydrolase family protein [Candidatus Dormibacteraeota bacterium]|jgi:2-keto-4-pentenoate hydratase/2-oxohepta-3-ene-1,7-dioic acid hydratase in catechol pathway|nr:fumarylacetoacetate hydrolase family protein [Candidatus Dormibacteraeota bacterium]
MKLGRISREGLDGAEARLVAVLPEQGRAVDLRRAEYLRLLGRGSTPEAAARLAAASFPGSMADAIGAGPIFLEAVHETLARGDDASLDLDSITWLPAVDPPVMRDCMAFKEHLTNAAARLGHEVHPTAYELPAYYKASQSSLIGHEQVVPWPAYTAWMDYELELGFVIGRPGRNLTPEQAGAHLFGVTIYNDFSARDIQGREMQLNLGPAKGKDFATAVGPWITTADELDLADLEMRARVNGEEWSRGNAGSIWWSPSELIAYVSWGENLRPGDLIGSGTVGRGCGLELGRRLQPGDVVELEVTGIGVLRNRLGEPEPRTWEPAPRPR